MATFAVPPPQTRDWRELPDAKTIDTGTKRLVVFLGCDLLLRWLKLISIHVHFFDPISISELLNRIRDKINGSCCKAQQPTWKASRRMRSRWQGLGARHGNRVLWRHVKGHSGHWFNDRADELAESLPSIMGPVR